MFGNSVIHSKLKSHTFLILRVVEISQKKGSVLNL